VPPALTPDALAFAADRHIATLATIGPDGGIHQVAIGFTLVDGVVRVITSDRTQKVRNVERDGRVSVSQHEGARWLSLSGAGTVSRDADDVAEAVALYTARYRAPRENPIRVVIRFEVAKAMGSSGLVERSG
jgi:F420H(2)-dependent biliverdin reductase